MYSREQLLKGFREPRKIVRELRRRVGAVQNRRAGHRVMDEDWDNLVILDACRYDLFESVGGLEGRLESRRSSGSATKEFLENNFRGTHHDTVYVSANPHITDLTDETFHAVVDVWREDWDEDHATVLPETMTRRCLDCHERFPDKRLICHYVQPHHPFLGPTAENDLPDTSGNQHARKEADTDDYEQRDHVWRRLARGELDIETVERAYRETLEVTLPHVEELIDGLPGKTVVTSDHGNLLDEPAYERVSVGTRRHDHPIYATAEPLVKVPWFVAHFEERKRITADPPAAPETDTETGTDPDEEVVDDRLEALGYK